LHIKKAEIIYELELQCQHLFNKNCKDMGIFLIRVDERKGIVKCNHIEKENTIKLLKSIKEISSNNVDIETVGTSGTIKTLIKKHMTN